jgi:hypothetical protein
MFSGWEEKEKKGFGIRRKNVNGNGNGIVNRSEPSGLLSNPDRV